MLIGPGAVGYLTAQRFETMMAIAFGSAVGSCIIGTLLSFHVDGATGPCIVLVQTTIFLVALVRSVSRTRRAEAVIR